METILFYTFRNGTRTYDIYAVSCFSCFISLQNKTRGQLSSDDMTSLGDLACGLDTSRIDDIDSNAMQDAAYNAQSKCVMLGTTERKKWAGETMKKMNL